jgi:hypothetical protein
MSAYSGADWIKKSMMYPKEMSELGKNVADLLGELFYGIYHLGSNQLRKVDWSNKHYIEFILGWKTLSTFDFDELTRLVFLAHHMAIRVEISPHAFNFIMLRFHQRQRNSDFALRHPTLDKAVTTFKTNVTIPEYID